MGIIEQIGEILGSEDNPLNDLSLEQCTHVGQFHLPPNFSSIDPNTLSADARASYESTLLRVQQSQLSIAQSLGGIADENPYVFHEGYIPPNDSASVRERDRIGANIPRVLGSVEGVDIENLSPLQKSIFTGFSGAEVSFYLEQTERPRTTITYQQSAETNTRINELTGGDFSRANISQLNRADATELFNFNVL